MPKPTISTCIQVDRVRGHSGCLMKNSTGASSAIAIAYRSASSVIGPVYGSATLAAA